MSDRDEYDELWTRMVDWKTRHLEWQQPPPIPREWFAQLDEVIKRMMGTSR